MPDVLVHTDTGIRRMSAAEADAAVRTATKARQRRAFDAQMARVDLELGREHATIERRRFLPRLTDATVRGLEEALLHRACPDRYPATPAAARWLDHCPLVEVAETWLTLAGDRDPRGRGRHGLAMALLTRGGAQTWAPIFRAQGYHGTKDLPLVLDGAAQTIFLDAYGDAVRSFTAWTTAVTVADFRSTIVSAAAFPSLLEVPEHAEYVAGNPFGPAVPVRLVKFGRVVNYTREAVLRDDLATFGQMQQALGAAAAQVENNVVYDLLLANPTMPDGQPLFSAAHGNLMPAKALDATSLADACAALATISEHGRPAYLLVGTADGSTARRLVTEETPPNANEASGVLEVIQDDRISAGFYVTTDPSERPTLVVAHLAGIDGPELLSQDSWTTDGRGYKGRDEFGAAVVDHKGLVYTPAV
jgi:hypothetical protein